MVKKRSSDTEKETSGEVLWGERKRGKRKAKEMVLSSREFAQF